VRLRFVVPAFFVLLCVSLPGFARNKRWYEQPGTPVTLEASGFVLKAKLPHGWSFTQDRGFVPPPAFASVCRVRYEFYADREWHRVLEPALSRPAPVEGARFGLKIGGHEALSNRYVRETTIVRDVYINLSDLQPDSGAIWSFEAGANTSQEEMDCETQFLAVINTAIITRRTP